MLHANTETHELVRQERYQDCVRRAETDCLCRDSGIDRRGLVTRAFCVLLARLGCILVNLGSSLQRLNGPAASKAPELTGMAGSQ